ncbi:hypothetical protein HCH15_05135 [Corynebacterium testudinoris]|nr:hypothetical protein [Corynebacterium testudinoris]
MVASSRGCVPGVTSTTVTPPSWEMARRCWATRTSTGSLAAVATEGASEVVGVDWPEVHPTRRADSVRVAAGNRRRRRARTLVMH